MSTLVQVVCPNPACPGRIVEGESVTRETWEATWFEVRPYAPVGPQPGEWGSDVSCKRCGHEGIDPESGQLDSAEEELGVRCAHCGVVSAKTMQPIRNGAFSCPYCKKKMSSPHCPKGLA